MVEGKVVNRWLQCGMQEYCSGYLKVWDESMSEIRFRITAKGNLPPLSYIFRKTGPLGTEFKTVACSIKWDLLFIEVQKGKEGMTHSKYHQDLGATAACTKRII